VLRDIFEIKREEVTGDWRKYILRSFMIFAVHHTFRGLVKEDEIGGACGTYWQEDKSLWGFDGET